MNEGIENKGSSPRAGIWIFNIALMIGLIVLYIFHFTARKDQGTKTKPQQDSAETSIGPRIAYIDSDSLMAHYEMVQEMLATFEASTRSKESKLRQQEQEFEKRVNDFRERMQSGSISMEIAQITEQQLMKEQQELIDLRDELAEQLAHEEHEMNRELWDNVSKFLAEYNRTRQFDLIFNYQHGTNIFIANQAYNITPEVVALLNHEHHLKKLKD